MRGVGKPIREGHNIYSLIVDGQTEIWYFQMMKQHESSKRMDIKPELPSRKKLVDQYNLVRKNAEDFFKVIWIIDFDTIIKEDREKNSSEKSKLLELKGYITKLNKLKNITVLINTPCLEFWYLLHLKESSHYYDCCSKVCRAVKNFSLLSDYKKSEAYYKKYNNDMYLKLKPLKNMAIANAKKLGDFDFDASQTAKAEIYKVFDLLDLNDGK